MPPERGSFYDSPDRQAIALGFLKKYLEVFDANRQVCFLFVNLHSRAA
jgi:hypothetical protein